MFATVALVMPERATAQDYSLQTGAPSFTTAMSVESGFINAANGNLHLEIPVYSAPQRGKIPYAGSLVYDARIWKIVQGTSNTWQPTNVLNSQGGWRFIDPNAAGTVTYQSQFNTRGRPPVCSYSTIYNYQWTTPDGVVRTFPFTTHVAVGDGCPNNQSGTALATDASGYRMSVTGGIHATIYAPDGTQVFPTYKDTNGNFFSKDANGNVIDTLGRAPVTYVANGTGCSTSYCYNVLNSQGTTSQIKVTTTTVNVNTSFGVSGVTDFSGSFTAISSIQLPDNTSYQFTYDSGTTVGHYGLLASMTIPTGGVVSYTYTNFTDAFGGVNRWIQLRSISGGGNWIYSPSVVTSCAQGQVGCQQKVTVAKPSGDNSVYTFTMNNGAWMSQRQDYTGVVSAPNLISTTSQTWDFSQSCAPTPCTGASNIRVLTTTKTLPTPGSSSITSQTVMTYADTNTPNLASAKAWKFYPGSAPTFPAIPDRESDYTYQASFGANILNRVTQIVTKDNTGAVVAQTNFSYDDAGTLQNTTPSTGIPEHDDANFGFGNTVRGNLTTVQRCTNLSSCTTNPVITTMKYDTTGQLVSVTDPNLNVTGFGYADNFFNDAANAGSI